MHPSVGQLLDTVECELGGGHPASEAIQNGHGMPHPYPLWERVGRLAWKASQILLVRMAPLPSAGIHRLLLRAFGARIGAGVVIYRSVNIEFPWMLEMEDQCVVGPRVRIYNLGKVRIGRLALISQGAHICAGTHDYEDTGMPLLRTPISIGAGAWLCAECFVGPGVEIGDHAVIGAHTVVTRDVRPWAVMAGNPAREVKQRIFRKISRPTKNHSE